MEGNEKGHDREPEEMVASREAGLPVSESLQEPIREDDEILEEFDKRRREAKIEYVQSVLEGILFRMGLEAKVVAEEMERDIRLEMRGDSSGLLIGKHGRTLDALQYILNKIYQRRFGEGEKIFVDAENYRKRRVEALENLALRLSEKVKRRNRAVVAGVFNSRDRRVIHMALKEDGLVETESRGDGFYKKLVIRPRIEVNEANNGEMS